LLLSFLVLHAVGAAGALIGRKLRLPAGAMVGAMVFTAVFAVLTESYFTYPPGFRPYLQVVSGALVGSKIGRQDLMGLKRLVVPILILVPMIFCVNILFGVLSAKLGGLDYATALFAYSPGGASDMALIAEDLGANSAYVAIIQLCRMLFIVSAFPFIFRHIFRNERQAALGQNASSVRQTSQPDVEQRKARREKMLRFAVTLGIALAGGLLFQFLSFPAGMMVGAMLAAAAFNIKTAKSHMPKWVLNVVQAAAGTYVGSGISREILLSMSKIAVPILLVLCEVAVLSFSSGFIISRAAKLPRSTCMFAGTPGGLQEMSLLSEEFGCDTASITILQTARLIAVISVFPLLIRLITSWLT